MPIYEYSCKKCEHQFEVLIRSDKDYPQKCPKCGAAKPEKQLSSFAVSASSSSANFEMPCTSCPSAGTGCGHSCSHDE